jgi:hypothetical protein
MKRLLSSLFLASSLLSACQPQEPELLDFETCDDNIDNDGDGLFDCSDDDCTLIDPVCAPDEQCNDNIDNDFNGLQDCQDDACSGTSDCMCIGTQGVFANELPLVIEGDSADGVFAINALGCQTGDTREAFFNLDFTVDRVDVLLEPLDDIPMVLQLSDACADDTFASCTRNQDSVEVAPVSALNVTVSNGSVLFFAGAREAGQTGRFRLTFTEAQ